MTTLPGPTLAECQANLAKLKQAKTDLLTGSLKAEIRYADKTVKYAATDIDKLNEAIRLTEAECNALAAGDSTPRRHGYVRPTL